ncbi:MAG: ketoacyl-ACP synthase III [Nitrospinae bacterium]|nr:ketoacyl-ACP synthase III [Nitrospinota bacterium]
MFGIKIIATGSYAPKKVLSNADLEKMVDTSDEWITTRTGIKNRHIAAKNETASAMGIKAGKNILEKSGIKPEEIELLVVATATPDMNFPSTACLIQTGLGLKNAVAFDISAACSGFIYSLSIVEQYLKIGTYSTAMIICTEKFSEIINWEDRNTCILFGDGAAGVIVKREEEQNTSVFKNIIKSDGKYADLLAVPDRKYIDMKGNTVFKIAIRSMGDITTEILKSCGLKTEDIALFIPHQANLRIINALGDLLKIPKEKVYINVGEYGNTSAASIPIALNEADEKGLIKKGDKIMFVAFGGGFTWGASIIEW